MINDLKWKDQAGRRTNTHLNVPSEGIIISMKGRTRKHHIHNTLMQIGSNIDNYKYYFYQQTIPELNNISDINNPMLIPSRID